MNRGFFLESEKRLKISLNGTWKAAFDNNEFFYDYEVPMCYDFTGDVIFRKKFELHDSIYSNYCFILVAEGINYESDISINGTFILKHTGGFIPIIIPIDENILRYENEITISVSNRFDNKNTIPLGNQIDYGINYGGIYRDIYIYAVPNLYTLDNHIYIKEETSNTARIINSISINSYKLTKLKEKANDFFITTKIIEKSSEREAASSNSIKFNIEDFQSKVFENEILLKNPSYWTAEYPNLYIIKTIISTADEIIDEKNDEYGLTKIKSKSGKLSVNGQEYALNGINYYEDLPGQGNLLNYSVAEADLREIKSLGFNCIRVPGRTVHPYITNICNRIGLFIMFDFPFNNVPERLLDNEEYTGKAADHFRNTIKFYRNNPSIISWGIGNNFDVTTENSRNYVKNMKQAAAELDGRPIYYTTFNYLNDICTELTDFKGLDLTQYQKEEEIKKLIDEYKRIQLSTANKFFIFISSYGLRIKNFDRGGYSNQYSVEAQTKFLVDCYKNISKNFWGNFITAYADWNSQRSLNYPMDENLKLVTNGLYDYNRNQKQSAGFVKRIINNQEISKISEGTPLSSISYVFLMSGIGIMIIFIGFAHNMKKFKYNMWKSLITPNNFLIFVREQMLISITQSLLLSAAISFGISLFFSSVFYLYRDNLFFDMILGATFTTDKYKTLFSNIFNYPERSVIFLALLNFILTWILTYIFFIVSFFSREKAHLKYIYTLTVWSSLPLLIFLPIGTIIYKISTETSDYVIFSFTIFAVLYALYLIRLVSGIKFLYLIPTLRSYIYGIVLIIFIYGGLYFYLSFFKSTFDIISILNGLK